MQLMQEHGNGSWRGWRAVHATRNGLMRLLHWSSSGKYPKRNRDKSSFIYQPVQKAVHRILDDFFKIYVSEI